MKRFSHARALMALLLCLCSSGFAIAEEPAVYTAISDIDFHIRPEAGASKHLKKVREDVTVEVLEYGESWCRVRYKDTEGYAQTKWLWGFVSLDPLGHPNPLFTPMKGLVRLSRETEIKGGAFSGLNAQAGILIAVYGEELSLPVWRGETALSAEDGVYTPFTSWQEAQPGDVIGGFTTYYNARTGAPLATERQHNIALGCERIDGHVVEVGESFSFNELCAPYKQSNGYLVAKNISHVGKGPGGGVCQVSTTLYNALLGLPLKITRWAAHRKRGVQYIPRSFDAAVGTYTDLCFENTLPYAVRLTALPQDGAVTVLISRN